MTMMQGLRDNLPVILQSGITILLELINGISATLPSLIPMAVECVLTLVQGLANNVPMLVDSAILLIESLAQGIINALPIIIEMAPNIIRSLIEGTVNATQNCWTVPSTWSAGLWDTWLTISERFLSALLISSWPLPKDSSKQYQNSCWPCPRL